VALATVITFVFHCVVITVFFKRMPLSYYVFGIIFQFVLILGIRFSYRFVLLERSRRTTNVQKARAKKVMIVGGGVAGLAAGFIAAERGHDVTLYESKSTLGGNMRLASFPPGKGDITNMIRAYIVRAQKAGVKIVMDTEVTLDFVKEEKPDEVIVATGAKTLILPIEGIDDPSIIHGGDLLAGKRQAGKKVLVVGGGMVGCEIAELLGELQHDVTVAEFRDTMGADMITEHRKFVMKGFDEYGVKQVPNARVCKFYTDGVAYEDMVSHETKELRGFDSVVLAMGYRNYDELSGALADAGFSVHAIGDAVRARRAIDATSEAYQVAMSL
jgi:NADPH-dependent 2,4-dienoyl-CoA reductase/sulfur reductase-like enzyme